VTLQVFAANEKKNLTGMVHHNSMPMFLDQSCLKIITTVFLHYMNEKLHTDHASIYMPN
jgi:hypothetical protein